MLGEIIPVVDVIKANKKLKGKNNSQDIEIPEYVENVDIKYLEEEYKNAIDAKNRFEDKAKTIIAALTIAITLILNLSKMIETISNKFAILAINYLIFILATIAIIYMLMAGIMSIQVLIKENVLYSVSSLERSEQDKNNIYIKTYLNNNQNLIRNNIIYSAYCSIRNSVICLVVIFIFAIIPFQITNNISLDNSKNISFGISAINWLSENDDRDICFEKIIDMFIEDKEDVVKNVYDKENQIIVTIKKVDNYYVIDNIMSDIEEVD